MALFVILVLFLSLSCYGVEGRNKISVGSHNQQNIQATNVNEFDCVDIYKQPAFDHPLLKNHKIQMNPSFSSKLMKNKELSFVEHSNFEFPSEGCPPGMVPIQKNRINDQTNLRNIHPFADTAPGNHFATFDSFEGTGPFYGASALIDVQNPHVEMNQLSMAQIWLQSGPTTELNSIQVGWGVTLLGIFNTSNQEQCLRNYNNNKNGNHFLRTSRLIGRKINRNESEFFFFLMINRYKHQQLGIGSVYAQQRSAWANKILPNGEIIGEVHPRIYGDNRTRVTALWTADNFQKTGCYNLLCPGFVQVHSSLYLGLPYMHISVRDGPQYESKPIVLQDKATGNWWLKFDQNITLGYWPKEIFTHLSTGASFVRFGGWTFESPDGLSPPMGSGLLPSKYTKRSCWFAQMQVAYSYGKLVDINGFYFQAFVNSNCYDLQYWRYQGSFLRQSMSFGGPGGRCDT